ncbi:MAG: hypothetical protein HDR50_09290 [Desulfovibrio sp.]|uniref:hypothetical protein n=1 Tax=Desulfovibrio sp. TaxID=885 RepID=UPI001A765A82|nr:hypothetical protein [Desulfovibrio sp.]MBD5417827.1 hypothetical protein [Desulfovibrio sp.]
MSRIRYTPEMVGFIIQHFEGRRISELTELFNNYFNVNCTEEKIKYICQKYRILKNTKFTKEMDSFIANNYKNYTPKRLLQEFNKKFSCDISFSKIRYKIKILSGDYINKDGKFISKARYLFIKYFGDTIPLSDNDVVIFKDGDNTNCSKDNLMKIDKHDLSYLAGLGLYNINEETTEAGLKIVQIMRKLEELKRHKKSN